MKSRYPCVYRRGAGLAPRHASTFHAPMSTLQPALGVSRVPVIAPLSPRIAQATWREWRRRQRPSMLDVFIEFIPASSGGLGIASFCHFS